MVNIVEQLASNAKYFPQELVEMLLRVCFTYK